MEIVIGHLEDKAKRVELAKCLGERVTIEIVDSENPSKTRTIKGTIICIKISQFFIDPWPPFSPEIISLSDVVSIISN